MLCHHKNAFSSTKTCISALWSAVELVLKTWVAVSAPCGHKKCHTEKAFSCHVVSLYSPVLKDVLRYRDVCLSPCLSKWDKIPGHFQIHIGLPIAAHTHFLLVYVVTVQSKHAIFIDFQQLLSGSTPVRWCAAACCGFGVSLAQDLLRMTKELATWCRFELHSAPLEGTAYSLIPVSCHTTIV